MIGLGKVCSTARTLSELARTFTPELLSEQACILILSAMHSHRMGADSHRDHFCCYKEGSCLGMKPAQRQEEGTQEEEERGLPGYCSALIIFQSCDLIIFPLCLFTSTWVTVPGNPNNVG